MTPKVAVFSIAWKLEDSCRFSCFTSLLDHTRGDLKRRPRSEGKRLKPIVTMCDRREGSVFIFGNSSLVIFLT